MGHLGHLSKLTPWRNGRRMSQRWTRLEPSRTLDCFDDPSQVDQVRSLAIPLLDGSIWHRAVEVRHGDWLNLWRSKAPQHTPRQVASDRDHRTRKTWGTLAWDSRTRVPQPLLARLTVSVRWPLMHGQSMGDHGLPQFFRQDSGFVC